MRLRCRWRNLAGCRRIAGSFRLVRRNLSSSRTKLRLFRVLFSFFLRFLARAPSEPFADGWRDGGGSLSRFVRVSGSCSSPKFRLFLYLWVVRDGFRLLVCFFERKTEGSQGLSTSFRSENHAWCEGEASARVGGFLKIFLNVQFCSLARGFLTLD